MKQYTTSLQMKSWFKKDFKWKQLNMYCVENCCRDVGRSSETQLLSCAAFEFETLCIQSFSNIEGFYKYSTTCFERLKDFVNSMITSCCNATIIAARQHYHVHSCIRWSAQQHCFIQKRDHGPNTIWNGMNKRRLRFAFSHTKERRGS